MIAQPLPRQACWILSPICWQFDQDWLPLSPWLLCWYPGVLPPQALQLPTSLEWSDPNWQLVYILSSEIKKITNLLHSDSDNLKLLFKSRLTQIKININLLISSKHFQKKKTAYSLFSAVFPPIKIQPYITWQLIYAFTQESWDKNVYHLSSNLYELQNGVLWLHLSTICDYFPPGLLE